MNKIPPTINYLFWDVNPGQIDMDEHEFFVVERVLEKGSLEDIKALFEEVEMESISEVCETSLNISRATRNFWLKYFKKQA